MRIVGALLLLLPLAGCVPAGAGAVGGVAGGLLANRLAASRHEAPQSPPPVRATTVRVDLYCLPWDLLTRRVLMPDDVRRQARTVLSIRDPVLVQEALALLSIDALRPIVPPDGRVANDARLVIDLTTDAGTIQSYHADASFLLSADSRLARPIDETFRRRVNCAEDPFAR